MEDDGSGGVRLRAAVEAENFEDAREELLKWKFADGDELHAEWKAKIAELQVDHDAARGRLEECAELRLVTRRRELLNAWIFGKDSTWKQHNEETVKDEEEYVLFATEIAAAVAARDVIVLCDCLEDWPFSLEEPPYADHFELAERSRPQAERQC